MTHSRPPGFKIRATSRIHNHVFRTCSNVEPDTTNGIELLANGYWYSETTTSTLAPG